jgi:hypothetical protein
LVDLGYDHNVKLFDISNEKGVSIQKLKNREPVILKVMENLD